MAKSVDDANTGDIGDNQVTGDQARAFANMLVQSNEECVAFARGYQSGIIGAERKTPEETIDHDQDWLKGYDAGQDSLAMDLIAKDKKTKAKT